jgi:predicted O-linked N-acetylglucosamine transferase (SPINDLY family)
MGLADHVADGASAYVDQALRLGTDSAYRNARKAEILERSDVLFEDPRVVREFERFFATALDERLAAAADSP